MKKYLAFIICAFLYSFSNSQCPSTINGFSSLGEFNGSAYYLSNEAVQPVDAQIVAQQNNGYLAVVNDQAENDFLQQNISEMVYIGLNDVQSEGNLVWGNGNPFNYNNINPCSFCNENSEDLDYVIMAPWDGTWSFSSQWNQRKYIVEKPCDNTGGGSITLNCPSDLELTTDPITGFATLVFPDATGITTCSNGGLSILNNGLLASGDQVGVGVYTISYEASDACNNGATCDFVITVVAVNTGGGCPEDISGFTTLGEFNGSKYFISDGTSQPANAQLVAQQNNGYLAVINDQSENDFLQQNISEMVYIGLNDVQTEGTLVWENGDPLSFNNINPCSFCNENAADLDYVIMAPWDGAWSFSSQWNQRKYIVEVPCNNSGGGSITLDCPTDLFLTTDFTTDLATLNFSDAVGSTTCPNGGLSILNTGLISSGDQVGVGVYTISFEATDACGNIEECFFDITVFDSTAMGNVISYGCPVEFPQPGIWEVPIMINNNSSFVSSPAILSLFKEAFSTGPNPQSPYGQMQLPVLQPGESLNILLETNLPNIPAYIPNRTTFPPHYIGMYNHKDYYISRSLTVPVKSLPFDFYCKKYSTDLEVVILNPTPNFTSNNEVVYSVSVTNKGSEDAFNIQTNLIQTIASSYASAMPPNTPVEYSVEVNNMSQGNWEREMGGFYNWYIPSLAVGATATVDVVYHLDDPLEYGSNLPETVTIDVSVTSGHLIDPDNSNNSDSFIFEKEVTGGGCPNALVGFTTLGEYNGSKYYISDGASLPVDAQLVAMQNGGYLAVVNDQSENDFIQQNITELTYIGLNDLQTEGTLVWGNGDPLNYNNINPCDFCNDNSADLDYVIMAPWDGTWSFSSQWNQRKYIVEIPCNDGGAPSSSCSFRTKFEDVQIKNLTPVEVLETSGGYEAYITIDSGFQKIEYNTFGEIINTAVLSPLPSIPDTSVRSEVGDFYFSMRSDGLELIISATDYFENNLWTHTYSNFFTTSQPNKAIFFEKLESNDGILFTLSYLKRAIKIDLDGNELWQPVFSNIIIPNNSRLSIGTRSIDGDYYLLWRGASTGYLYKFDNNDGTELWEVEANPAQLIDWPMVVESEDGSEIYFAANLDVTQAFVKGFYTTDGSLLWSKRLFGPYDYFDYGYKSTIDTMFLSSEGNVIVSVNVTDFSQPFSAGVLFRFFKINTVTGEYEWNYRLTPNDDPIIPNNPDFSYFMEGLTDDDGILFSVISDGFHELLKFNEDGQFDPVSNDNGVLPDLHIRSALLECGNGLPGSNFEIIDGGTECSYAIDFLNQSISNPSGEFVISVYLSEDNFFDNGDYFIDSFNRSSLSYGVLDHERRFFNMPNLPNDLYYKLLFIIDEGDQIAESVEDNNLTLSRDFDIAESNSLDCPNQVDGFSLLGENNGSAYFLSDNTDTPIQAQMEAEAMGGYLAVINDQAENDFIQQSISSMAYIGLNDLQIEGTLIWENGDSLNYNNINPCDFCNENADDLDYVIMAPWDGTWSFSSQWNQRKYIVEIPCTQMLQSPNVNNNLNIDISNAVQLDKLILEKLYPNPTTEEINLVIQSPMGQDVVVQIFDARGVLHRKVILNLKQGENLNIFSIEDLPEGFYSLIIPNSEGRKLVKRFVKI